MLRQSQITNRPKRRESEELFFDESITKAEDERTTMTKGDTSNAKRAATEAAHKLNSIEIGLSLK